MARSPTTNSDPAGIVTSSQRGAVAPRPPDGQLDLDRVGVLELVQQQDLKPFVRPRCSAAHGGRAPRGHESRAGPRLPAAVPIPAPSRRSSTQAGAASRWRRPRPPGGLRPAVPAGRLQAAQIGPTLLPTMTPFEFSGGGQRRVKSHRGWPIYPRRRPRWRVHASGRGTCRQRRCIRRPAPPATLRRSGVP